MKETNKGESEMNTIEKLLEIVKNHGHKDSYIKNNKIVGVFLSSNHTKHSEIIEPNLQSVRLFLGY